MATIQKCQILSKRTATYYVEVGYGSFLSDPYTCSTFTIILFPCLMFCVPSWFFFCSLEGVLLIVKFCNDVYSAIGGIVVEWSVFRRTNGRKATLWSATRHPCWYFSLSNSLLVHQSTECSISHRTSAYLFILSYPHFLDPADLCGHRRGLYRTWYIATFFCNISLGICGISNGGLSFSVGVTVT